MKSEGPIKCRAFLVGALGTSLSYARNYDGRGRSYEARSGDTRNRSVTIDVAARQSNASKSYCSNNTVDHKRAHLILRYFKARVVL